MSSLAGSLLHPVELFPGGVNGDSHTPPGHVLLIFVGKRAGLQEDLMITAVVVAAVDAHTFAVTEVILLRIRSVVENELLRRVDRIRG